jgi:hypothetical protein
MGRIRRTIIMGNPRGFVLKKFALIIATWAVVSVLVPSAYLWAIKRADERTRTADLLITSEK